VHILVIYFTVVPAFFFVLIKDVSKREDKPKNDYEGCKNESELAPGELAPGRRCRRGGRPRVHRRAARARGRARESRETSSLSLAGARAGGFDLMSSLLIKLCVVLDRMLESVLSSWW